MGDFRSYGSQSGMGLTLDTEAQEVCGLAMQAGPTGYTVGLPKQQASWLGVTLLMLIGSPLACTTQDLPFGSSGNCNARLSCTDGEVTLWFNDNAFDLTQEAAMDMATTLIVWGGAPASQFVVRASARFRVESNVTRAPASGWFDDVPEKLCAAMNIDAHRAGRGGEFGIYNDSGERVQLEA